MFKAELVFPTDYPNQPPKMRFLSEMHHPNVYAADGRVCISILHAPGEDNFGYEAAEERWRPIHTAESILVSVISMIADPNVDSPANIDAAVRLPPLPSLPPRLPSVALGGLGSRGSSCCARCSQKMFREDRDSWKKAVKRCVRKSQDDFC